MAVAFSIAAFVFAASAPGVAALRLSSEAEAEDHLATVLDTEQAPAQRLRDRVEGSDPWPTMRGPYMHPFGATSSAVPRDLSAALAWKWQHPAGKYQIVIGGGPTIDAHGNVYFTASDGIRKLDSDGTILWQHEQIDRAINNAPSLYGGSVFCVDEQANAFALDQKDGRVLWSKKLADRNNGDSGYPAAFDGVFVVAVDDNMQGPTKVLGLDTVRGDLLWEFHPDAPLWDFTPQFARGHRVVFNDKSGGVYSLALHTGKKLWHTLNVENTSAAFSDAGVTLGPNDDVFQCTNPEGSNGFEGMRGMLRRISLTDGAVLWEQHLPHPCNSWPAIGEVGPKKELSVVVAPGAFMARPNIHGSVMAFDALTGAVRWRHNMEVYSPPPPYWARGDLESYEQRLKVNPRHPFCMPGHWSSPVIDGQGVVHAGRADGFVYSFREEAGFVAVREKSTASLDADFSSTPGIEVASWDAETPFLHGAIAFGPNRMVIGGCDTLYAFNI